MAFHFYDRAMAYKIRPYLMARYSSALKLNVADICNKDFQILRPEPLTLRDKYLHLRFVLKWAEKYALRSAVAEHLNAEI